MCWYKKYCIIVSLSTTWHLIARSPQVVPFVLHGCTCIDFLLGEGIVTGKLNDINVLHIKPVQRPLCNIR